MTFLRKLIWSTPFAFAFGRQGILRRVMQASVSFALVAGLSAPADAARKFRQGSIGGTKPELRRDFGEMPKGPMQIVVSIAHQRVTLYSNGARIAQGPVSTGVPGHPTPMGVFSVIQKNRHHRSNLYSNAPMPFMQRITWSGIAMHEGPLPGYPASHGCIRLTHDFASRLWTTTKLGARVIVARNDVVPVDFTHHHLFVPKLKPAEQPVAGIEPEMRAKLVKPVQIAQTNTRQDDMSQERAVQGEPTSAEASKAAEPVTPNQTTAGGVETMVAAEPKPVEATQIAETANAIEAAPATAESATPPQAGLAASELGKPPETPEPPKPRVPSNTKVADQPAKRSGQVAVFVSRKEKKIFVRQGFAPLFEMPVTIDNPGQPLGTHVFTAMEASDNGTGMRWNVITIATEQTRTVEPSGKRKKSQQATAPKAVEAKVTTTPEQAIDRIHFPKEATDRIGELLTPGSSLVVSDQGLGPETGKYTDFIVVTR